MECLTRGQHVLVNTAAEGIVTGLRPADTRVFLVFLSYQTQNSVSTLLLFHLHKTPRSQGLVRRPPSFLRPGSDTPLPLTFASSLNLPSSCLLSALLYSKLLSSFSSAVPSSTSPPFLPHPTHLPWGTRLLILNRILTFDT